MVKALILESEYSNQIHQLFDWYYGRTRDTVSHFSNKEAKSNAFNSSPSQENPGSVHKQTWFDSKVRP